HLHDERRAGRHRRLLPERRRAVHAPAAAVLALEGRGLATVLGRQPGDAQDRVDGFVAQLLVLWRERVDRRRDQHHARGVEAFPLECRAREDVAQGGRYVWAQELPGFPAELVRLVDTDVAAP